MVQGPEVTSVGVTAPSRTNRSAQQVEEIRKRFLEEYERNPGKFKPSFSFYLEFTILMLRKLLFRSI